MSRPIYSYGTGENQKCVTTVLIPKILKLIEESGISFIDAAVIPDLLKAEIEQHTRALNYRTKFMLDERSMH